MKLAPPLLLGSLLLFMLLALFSGASDIPLRSIISGSLSPVQQSILYDIRLPRVLLVLLVGAAVAMAGAAIQGIFRNPLADPALIGVSSGAALFAAGFLVLGPFGPFLNLVGVSGSAFVGGLVATFLVLLIGRRSHSLSGMLLAGIAINAVALSGVGLFTFITDDTQLRSVAFWALGSFSGADWQGVMVALLMLPFMGLLVLEGRRLDVVTLGDTEAAHLGIHVRRLRLRVIVYCALVVGISVSLAGIISFIGLVVPHLVRLSRHTRHRSLLPMSALLGATILLAADMASRLLFLPAELPVGILTALVGGPFFMYLIYTQRSRIGM